MNINFYDDFCNRVGEEKFKIYIEFFILFSRFESILKEFLYINKDKVDWDKFISEEKQNIINLEKNKTVEDSYTFLVENPPKKQIIEDGILVWKKVDETGDDIFLTSRYIGRVRNNLFHGAKFGIENLERDIELLEHSMNILKHWLNLDKFRDKI